MTVRLGKSNGGRQNGDARTLHKKSRSGCGNCKLRKVKCDESKPMCQKCQAYGTFCNYNPQYSDLQPLVYGCSNVNILQPSLCSKTTAVLAIIDGSRTSPKEFYPAPLVRDYHFSVQDLELLHKFQTKTISALGTGMNEELYRNAFAKLTLSHPVLWHIVLTVTLFHEQYLGIGVGANQSTAIAFHWSQGAALLNSKLSCAIEPSERDALWACAAMLGALVFSSIQAKTPEEAWPLWSSPSDLDWLTLCEGKKEIWKITNPMRKDSVFHSIIPNFLASPSACSNTDLRKLPPELIELCRLDDIPLQEDNPYLEPAYFLAQMINMECNGQTVGLFLSFFGCISSNYKQLLKQKDSCAILLLAYWYAKMATYRQWWVSRRAVLECQAICKYLRLYHGHDNNILQALKFPETTCASQSIIGRPIFLEW